MKEITTIFSIYDFFCNFFHVVAPNTQFMSSSLCLVLDPMSDAFSKAVYATADQF
ncbi:hypothetical protein C4J91_4343 [Pseudomonas sp. R3-52-08]|nr:hypothetical protein C4J91_4343 [Pseudomonas sp. R3-52-08]